MTPIVRDVLDRLSIDYEIITCDPQFADTAAFTEHYAYPPEASVNTIIVASRRGPVSHAAAAVLATTRLDVNRRMKQLMGVGKASFASLDETRALTGMEIGGVTAIGLPDALPLYVDMRVMEREWVILGGGDRRSKVRVAPRLFVELASIVVDGLATPIPLAAGPSG